MLYSRKSIRLEAEFLQARSYPSSGIANFRRSIHESVDEDNVLLKATVLDSLELRFWLRSFGDEVEIIRPLNLRTEFANAASTLASYYG